MDKSREYGVIENLRNAQENSDLWYFVKDVIVSLRGRAASVINGNVGKIVTQCADDGLKEAIYDGEKLFHDYIGKLAWDVGEDRKRKGESPKGNTWWDDENWDTARKGIIREIVDKYCSS